MEVTFKTTVEDYIAFNLHMYRRSKVTRTNYLTGWLFFPVLCLVGTVTLVVVIGFGVWAALCAAAGILFALVYPFLQRWSDGATLREYLKEQDVRGLVGRIVLVLTEESLVEVTELTRSEAKWQDMKGIEEVGAYTFIYVTGMQAAILPRHGFDRDDNYFRARDFARERIPIPVLRADDAVLP
jgi:hypothetical protein